jgi:hypothetical protein
MGEREPRHASATQLAMVLIVLCVGFAGGALLARFPVAGIPVSSVGVAPGPPSAEGGTSRVDEPHSMIRDSMIDPVPSGTPYAPVAGSVVYGDSIGRGGMDMQERVPDAPRMLVAEEQGAAITKVVVAGGDSTTASLPAPRPEAVDDVASLTPKRASEAVLFAVSAGHETVLYDVGIAGADALPASVRGAWAWVGSCSEVRVEISQLPGAPSGAVRGVGTGPSADRFGWVVPRLGCRSASRKVSMPTTPSPRPEDVDAPGEVRELRSLGEHPCEAGRTCSWYAGLDSRGRAVALLVRATAHQRWISLGPGAFARR